MLDFGKLNDLKDELGKTESLIGSTAQRCKYDLQARASELEARIQEEERLIVAAISRVLDFVEKYPKLRKRIRELTREEPMSNVKFVKGDIL
jgi:hypothetical protein